MSSPQLVTLFTQSGGPARSRTSVALSVVLHSAGIAAVFVGIFENPRIVETPGPSYAVHMVHMKAPEPTPAEQAPDEVASPVPNRQAAGVPSPDRHAPHPASHKAHAAQLLLQADTPVVEIDKALVPSLLILSPKQIIDIRQIVPQLPTPAVRTQVRPTMDMPTSDAPLADVQISQTPFASEKLNLPASATTPVAAQGTAAQGPAPQTRSESNAEAAPAPVLSLSDLQTSGAFVLPHVSTAPVRPGDAATASRNSGAATDPTPASAGTPGDASASQGSAASALSSTVRRITLPKDGKFAMVLVGNSIDEAYPETADTWRGRPAYTVYLHVGLPKSWIFQYALPRSADANGAVSTARLEAPWPTNMLVPNLDNLSSESEALIVHGVLTAEGRFDQLTIVLPAGFSHSAFVLDVLKQWLFRPATQNGQPVPVEFLLVIPDQEL